MKVICILQQDVAPKGRVAAGRNFGAPATPGKSQKIPDFSSTKKTTNTQRKRLHNHKAAAAAALYLFRSFRFFSCTAAVICICVSQVFNPISRGMLFHYSLCECVCVCVQAKGKVGAPTRCTNAGNDGWAYQIRIRKSVLTHSIAAFLSRDTGAAAAAAMETTSHFYRLIFTENVYVCVCAAGRVRELVNTQPRRWWCWSHPPSPEKGLSSLNGFELLIRFLYGVMVTFPLLLSLVLINVPSFSIPSELGNRLCHTTSVSFRLCRAVCFGASRSNTSVMTIFLPISQTLLTPVCRCKFSNRGGGG